MPIDVPTPDRIPMSQRERDVLKVLHTVLSGERTQAEAARLLGLSTRQVRRLQRKLQASGDQAVVHGLRGRPSNHQPDAAALHPHCCGRTPAAPQLLSAHGIPSAILSSNSNRAALHAWNDDDAASFAQQFLRDTLFRRGHDLTEHGSRLFHTLLGSFRYERRGCCDKTSGHT